MSDWENKLYYGDNLDRMRQFDDESVDLIYLDPPFNSKATYNVLFKEKNGTDSSAQITAFDDTWHWNIESEEAYKELVTNCPDANAYPHGTTDLFGWMITILYKYGAWE